MCVHGSCCVRVVCLAPAGLRWLLWAADASIAGLHLLRSCLDCDDLALAKFHRQLLVLAAERVHPKCAPGCSRTPLRCEELAGCPRDPHAGSVCVEDVIAVLWSASQRLLGPDGGASADDITCEACPVRGGGIDACVKAMPSSGGVVDVGGTEQASILAKCMHAACRALLRTSRHTVRKGEGVSSCCCSSASPHAGAPACAPMSPQALHGLASRVLLPWLSSLELGRSQPDVALAVADLLWRSGRVLRDAAPSKGLEQARRAAVAFTAPFCKHSPAMRPWHAVAWLQRAQYALRAGSAAEAGGGSTFSSTDKAIAACRLSSSVTRSPEAVASALSTTNKALRVARNTYSFVIGKRDASECPAGLQELEQWYVSSPLQPRSVLRASRVAHNFRAAVQVCIICQGVQVPL